MTEQETAELLDLMTSLMHSIDGCIRALPIETQLRVAARLNELLEQLEKGELNIEEYFDQLSYDALLTADERAYLTQLNAGKDFQVVSGGQA